MVVLFPPPHTIVTYPPLAALVNGESDHLLPVGDPRLVASLASLASAPAFVDVWCEDTQTLLVSLVPGVHAGTPALGVLERATSIFQIRNVYSELVPAIGWHEARAHLHWCREPPRSTYLVKFSASASAVQATPASRLPSA
ncbi:hypothetical protein DFH06DRAFT_1332800 [Mycena polygramma]|nr:hypothetical protein DFH06DRAFT_1332800 [Mycena polygramma]